MILIESLPPEELFQEVPVCIVYEYVVMEHLKVFFMKGTTFLGNIKVFRESSCSWKFRKVLVGKVYSHEIFCSTREILCITSIAKDFIFLECRISTLSMTLKFLCFKIYIHSPAKYWYQKFFFHSFIRQSTPPAVYSLSLFAKVKFKNFAKVCA